VKPRQRVSIWYSISFFALSCELPVTTIWWPAGVVAVAYQSPGALWLTWTGTSPLYVYQLASLTKRPYLLVSARRRFVTERSLPRNAPRRQPFGPLARFSTFGTDSTQHKRYRR